MRLIDADVLIKHLCEIMTTANHFGNIERVSEIGACIGVIKGEKTINQPRGELSEDYKDQIIGWLSKFCFHIAMVDKHLTDDEAREFWEKKMHDQFGW